MKIKVSEKTNSVSGTKQSVIIIQNVGLQGAKGENAYPDGGEDGNLLEKQVNGIGWTSSPKNLTLNGGNF